MSSGEPMFDADITLQNCWLIPPALRTQSSSICLRVSPWTLSTTRTPLHRPL